MLLQHAHADGGFNRTQLDGEVIGDIARHVQQGISDILFALVHHVFNVQVCFGQNARDGRDRARGVLVDDADAAASHTRLADIRQVDAVGDVAVFR